MKRNGAILSVAVALAGMEPAAHGQVFFSEFFADPVFDGWDSSAQACNPLLWVDQGWYHQKLDLGGCAPPGGGADVYRRWLDPYDGVATFYADFRVQTDGNRSEIPGGAPALFALGNDAGVLYHITVSRDLVKFLRDAWLPILFIEIEPGVPRTYRVELTPGRYAFYIDADRIDEGVAEGAFPAHTSSIPWLGGAWYLPCHNAWDYIRYGVIPLDASGDFDSDEAVTADDYYFFHDCLMKDGPGIVGGPGSDAGPGCRFADFDANADTDLSDFAEFQNLFTGSPE